MVHRGPALRPARVRAAQAPDSCMLVRRRWGT